MKSVHDQLRERLHLQAGIGLPAPRYTPTMLEYARANKWSTKFEELMRNRLVMGAMRYSTPAATQVPGFTGDGRPTKVQSADIAERIKQYEIDGNSEHLVDIANLCMIEFETSDHPLAHFQGTDRMESK
jgi:hypothetical protein